MKVVCVSNILGCFLIPCWRAIVTNMIKCPRCKLPQAGIYKCQFCGYDLNKYNKKPTTIIRKRLKDIVGGFKKGQIVSSDKKSKVRSMKNTGKAKKSTDHFGSRSGTDRRQQKNTTYFPERRSGMDRRK
jgi:ribosomal protein L37AE/L43A